MASEPAVVHALARLADRQGMLQGDLNKLQQKLLTFLINEEGKASVEEARQKFKLQMIATHPDKAEKIMAIFSDDDVEVAEELSDEEMDELGPLSGDQVEEAIDALRSIGLAVVTDT